MPATTTQLHRTNRTKIALDASRARARLALLLLAALGAGCSGTEPPPPPPDADPLPDGPAACTPPGATGTFTRRPTNPRLLAGHHRYSDNKVDIGLADPDLRWDDASGRWVVYFHGPHAADFQSPITQMVRRATSLDLAAWTI